MRFHGSRVEERVGSWLSRCLKRDIVIHTAIHIYDPEYRLGRYFERVFPYTIINVVSRRVGRGVPAFESEPTHDAQARGCSGIHIKAWGQKPAKPTLLLGMDASSICTSLRAS